MCVMESLCYASNFLLFYTVAYSEATLEAALLCFKYHKESNTTYQERLQLLSYVQYLHLHACEKKNCNIVCYIVFCNFSLRRIYAIFDYCEALYSGKLLLEEFFVNQTIFLSETFVVLMHRRFLLMYLTSQNSQI